MAATTYQDLPLADRSRPWDADRAEASVRRWAQDGDDIDWAKYREAFFWYDEENAETLGAYKLGFAEVIDGRLLAVPRGVFAAAAAVQGSRGGVDIPADDMEAVRAHIARYYEKLDMTPPWDKALVSVEHKSFVGCDVKDGDAGVVVAVFSTFGVVDHDFDIVEPGAIKEGPVRVSAYGHGSWGGVRPALLPVGRGHIYTDDSKAWAEMQFFMDTTHGRDTFHTIKGMGDLQEWSYSLRNIQAEYDEIDGQRVRRIKAVDVHEVSPVLMGASIGTHTVAVKSGLRFSEHIDAVVADVCALNERVREVVALRTQKGRALSEASLKQIERLRTCLADLEELLVVEPKTDEKARDVLLREYLRFLSLT